MLLPTMPVAEALSAEEWDRRAAPCFEQVFADDDPYGRPFRPEIERRIVLFPIAHELEEGQFDALARAASREADDRFYFFTEQQSTVDPMEQSGHSLWAMPFDFGAYSNVGALDLSALCSPSGRWGVLVSNDGHAVVGGSDGFIAQLVTSFPPTQEPVTHWHVEMPDVRVDMSREEQLELMEALKTPVPMRTGEPPGDGQVRALIDFWSFFRDYERAAPGGRAARLLRRNPQPESGNWIPGLLAHLYGDEAAAEYLDEADWR